MRDVNPWAMARQMSGQASQEALLRHMAATPAITEIEEMAATTPIFSAIEERFRQIAARCFDTTHTTGSQSLAVSSPTGGARQTSTAVGVAVAAARNLGTDVLLVETNMAHPQLAGDFGVNDLYGLSEYLSSEVELETVLQPTRVPNVWLLPAGRPTRNPGPLIRSQKFQDLMVTLHGGYRTIVLDVPPLLTSPHASVIANQAGGLVLVVRAGGTHAHDATAALRAIGDLPVRGTVLNGTRTWLPAWMARMLGVSRFAIE
jgi:capsular exopolysaccharide synthesis family protein